MPTYEYRCADCDKTFDVVQAFHDDALTECPTCGNPVRKVFGNVGVVFKGSGFYKNDSRPNGSSKASDGGDSSSKDASGSGSDGSADAGATRAPSPDSTKGSGGSDGGSKPEISKSGGSKSEGSTSTSTSTSTSPSKIPA
ncbi:MAG: FmdB family zinc ribbon protein [Acidimicrobiales bacterium]